MYVMSECNLSAYILHVSLMQGWVIGLSILCNCRDLFACRDCILSKIQYKHVFVISPAFKHAVGKNGEDRHIYYGYVFVFKLYLAITVQITNLIYCQKSSDLP